MITIAIKVGDEGYSKEKKLPQISNRKFKSVVLNILLRHKFLRLSSNETAGIVSKNSFDKISRWTNFSQDFVKQVVRRYLFDVENYKKFVQNSKFKWPYELDQSWKKASIYLRKMHRIAPVFDYERARINLRTLQQALYKKRFWPRLSTQLSVTIRVTDMLDKNYEEKLVQSYVRYMCKSSAFAYHKTKNLLKIK